MSEFKQTHNGAENEEASSEGSNLLSGSEIDDLLNAIDEVGEADEGSLDGESSSEQSKSRAVKIYDFLRPDRFTPQEIECLAELGHEYAARLRDLLTANLKRNCTISLTSVDQLRMDEYSRGLGDPDTIALISAPGYPPFYIEFSMTAMRLFLAGLVGMSKPLSEKTSIPQSFFFRRLVECLLSQTVLPALFASWGIKARFPYTLQRVFYTPSEIIEISSYEMLLILSLEIAGPDEFTGLSTVAIPHRLGEDLIPVLAGEVERRSHRTGAGTVTEGPGADAQQKAIPKPEQIRVSARPEFPLLGVSRKQLEKWGKGSSIRLRGGYSGRYI